MMQFRSIRLKLYFLKIMEFSHYNEYGVKKSQDSDPKENGDLEEESGSRSGIKSRFEIPLRGKTRLERQTLPKTKFSLALKIPTCGQCSAREVASRKEGSS